MATHSLRTVDSLVEIGGGAKQDVGQSVGGCSPLSRIAAEQRLNEPQSLLLDSGPGPSAGIGRQPRSAQMSLRGCASRQEHPVDGLPNPERVDDRRTYGGSPLSAGQRESGGNSQVKTSKATTPNDHMSADGWRCAAVPSRISAPTNSGGVYALTRPSAAICPSTAACSRSTSFHALSAANHIRCEGLRHPWTMPLEWRASSASSTWRRE